MHQYVKFIPPKAKIVIEFGCTDSSIGSDFCKIQPECRYVGVNENLIELRQSADKLSQLAWGSFNSIDLAEHGIWEADCIICHSASVSRNDFWKAWQRHTALLSQNGQLLFIMDNPGYFRNAVELLQGKKPHDTVMDIQTLLAGAAEQGMRPANIYSQYSADDKIERENPATNNLLTAANAWLQLHGSQLHNSLWVKKFIIRFVFQKLPDDKILLQTLLGETKVCSRVRIEEPHSFMETIPGVVHQSSSRNLVIEPQSKFPKQVFIRQRVNCSGKADFEKLKKLLSHGSLLIYEIDDNPLLWAEGYNKGHWADFVCCHAVQVSTEPLAELVRRFNPNVTVFKNHLKYLPAKRSYSADEPVTIFFGALNRTADWQEIMPFINTLSAKYKGKIKFKVLFDKSFYEALETTDKELLGQEYEYGLAPYSVYEEILHSSDIALLPLAATEFNKMKSDLKFIESAGHGAAVLASPTVYEQSVRDGRTGFIYHSPEEFAVKLEQLINDTALRLEMAEAAWQYVKHERLLSQHYEERYQYYQALFAHKPSLDRYLQQQILKIDKAFADDEI